MANNLLEGKRGIIFGALDERSIAWKTALRCYEEGAQLVLTNAPVALRMGEINKLSALCGNAPVIGADVTNMDDLKNLFEQSMSHFGGGSRFRTGSPEDSAAVLGVVIRVDHGPDVSRDGRIRYCERCGRRDISCGSSVGRTCSWWPGDCHCAGWRRLRGAVWFEYGGCCNVGIDQPASHDS